MRRHILARPVPKRTVLLALGGVVGVDLEGPRGHVPAVDGAVEQLQARDGLVVGERVARREDAREAEVAGFARVAVVYAVDEAVGKGG